MNEKQPYEYELNQQFQNLPLPDTEQSWRKMSAMLDEDERKRGILPFFTRYGMWLLIILMLAGGTWYLLTNPSGKSVEDIAKKDVTNDKSNAEVPIKKFEEKQDQSPNTLSIDKAVATNSQTVDSKVTPATLKTVNKLKTTGGTLDNNSLYSTLSSPSENSADNKTISNTTIEKNSEVTTGDIATNITTSNSNSAGIAPFSLNKSSIDNDQINSSTHIDSNVKTDVLSAEGIDLTLNTKESGVVPDSNAVLQNVNNLEKPISRLMFSAGIAEQQQIPIAGQSTTNYNDNGTANILKDYIPAVYLRAQKGKWFLQASFKYASAQFVTKSSFHQQTKYESSTKTTIQNSSSLQKIYYHQLPVSLNYELFPNWSVGAGGMFNWLHSTIIQNKTTISDAASNNLISEKLRVKAVKAFTDSFFYATPFNALLQTEYQLNRLSFGLRYSWGLQPYLRYTMPDGSVKTQFDQSLQLILRFRIWETPKTRRPKIELKTPD